MKKLDGPGVRKTDVNRMGKGMEGKWKKGRNVGGNGRGMERKCEVTG